MHFEIPEPIESVQAWFMGKLETLTPISMSEGPRIELMIAKPEPPQASYDLYTNAIVTEIEVRAIRTVLVPPETEARSMFDVGTLIALRLYAFSDTATTVQIMWEDRPSVVTKIVELIMQDAEERYPQVAGLQAGFRAEILRRMRNDQGNIEQAPSPSNNGQSDSQLAQASENIDNGDLSELNRRLPLSAMKPSFRGRAYDPQKLLYILNKCLSPAWAACLYDGENWMTKGQSYIMRQSPGVDESDLSRYLRSARKIGMLEWRGVELPGRPLNE